MSENDYAKILSKNIKFYMEKYEMNQAELARRLNVSATMVSYWLKGEYSPRMDKIDAMCEMFHCKRADLAEEHEEGTQILYFGGNRYELPPEILNAVITMIDQYKK